VALGRLLADPSGELGDLRRQASTYPEPLRSALAAAAWEADFSTQIAGQAAPRGDVLYVSLCLSRAIGVLVQALFAYHRRWCLNEKGALAAVEGMPAAPADFTRRARALLGHPGTTAGELTVSVASAAALVTEVRAVLTDSGR